MSMEWHNATYPKPLRREVGCKVSWYTYATKEEAERVSKIAEKDAAEQRAEGFDFGYLWPGDIRKEDDGTFTVVIP